MNYKNVWLNACFGVSPKNLEIIAVTFKDGITADYPITSKEMLKEELRVKQIVSLETGEIYFERDNAGNVTINC
jgi:hypothetical protein